MRFSVVIPTYNRVMKLREALRALEAQEFDRDSFEVLVVNDGSTDDTYSFLERFGAHTRLQFRFFTQPNHGQGVARNRGVAEAKGEIILFLGDDIVAEPRLLKEHDRVHQFHPQIHVGVLGHVTWHLKLPISPLMRFMERGGAIFGRFGGHQFAYDLLEGKRIADHRFFYTANISLKRELLLEHAFDPWFSGYGWEDIELGYRLEKHAGLVLRYEPAARAFHDHFMDEKAFAKRMREIGISTHRIHKKYPELGRLPSRTKYLIMKCLTVRPALSLASRIHQNLYFYLLSKKFFLEGIDAGYNGNDHA